MTQEVKPQDHPDFIGGWVWTELESRWIEERIAKTILAEREACAKLCDSTIEQTYISGYTGAVHSARRECAAAIRARGQA
jgi:hypothetical protein